MFKWFEFRAKLGALKLIYTKTWRLFWNVELTFANKLYSYHDNDDNFEGIYFAMRVRDFDLTFWAFCMIFFDIIL